VTALCGTAVEHGEGWLVEGVWDAPFEAGEFHLREAFFGSGLRVDGDEVTACASTALVDRLLYSATGEHVVVSNSLPLLLAVSGARLVADHDYREDCRLAQHGISGPTHGLPVAHPLFDRFSILVHGNLVVGPDGERKELRSAVHRFASYDDYLSRLNGTLARLADNWRSPARCWPLTPASCVSAGFDSPAVAALVRPLGVRDCFTTRPGDDPPSSTIEDGAAVATALGLELHLLRPPAEVDELETYFMTATAEGSELWMHAAARRFASAPGVGLLFSGHCGDFAWQPSATDCPPGDVRRGDDSGLHLAEVRLRSGFVHVPLPFLFARSFEDLHRIARSPEMAPWRLGTDYDRPIPRRILESAGVPGRLFGQRKSAIFVYTYPQPYNRLLRSEFVAWLGARLPAARLCLALHHLFLIVDRKLAQNAKRVGLDWRRWRLPRPIRRWPLGGLEPRHLVFQWANERLAGELAAGLGPLPAAFGTR